MGQSDPCAQIQERGPQLTLGIIIKFDSPKNVTPKNLTTKNVDPTKMLTPENLTPNFFWPTKNLIPPLTQGQVVSPNFLMQNNILQIPRITPTGRKVCNEEEKKNK